MSATHGSPITEKRKTCVSSSSSARSPRSAHWNASNSEPPPLAKLAPRVQWQHSYVAADRTFCVYLAEDEAVIRQHAEISGFPATRIVEITKVIDPSTARNPVGLSA